MADPFSSIYNRPQNEPRWGESVLGTKDANLAEPTSGQKDTGWALSQVPPSSFENWRANLAFRWHAWVGDWAYSNDPDSVEASPDSENPESGPIGQVWLHAFNRQAMYLSGGFAEFDNDEDTNGGTLHLRGGASTGTGVSSVVIAASSAGVAGSAINAPTTLATFSDGVMNIPSGVDITYASTGTFTCAKNATFSGTATFSASSSVTFSSGGTFTNAKTSTHSATNTFSGAISANTNVTFNTSGLFNNGKSSVHSGVTEFSGQNYTTYISEVPSAHDRLTNRVRSNQVVACGRYDSSLNAVRTTNASHWNVDTMTRSATGIVDVTFDEPIYDIASMVATVEGVASPAIVAQVIAAAGSPVTGVTVRTFSQATDALINASFSVVVVGSGEEP